MSFLCMLGLHQFIKDTYAENGESKIGLLFNSINIDECAKCGKRICYIEGYYGRRDYCTENRAKEVLAEYRAIKEANDAAEEEKLKIWRAHSELVNRRFDWLRKDLGLPTFEEVYKKNCEEPKGNTSG